MEANRSDAQESPCHPLDAHIYTGTETLLHNVPYLLMIILGSAVLVRSLEGLAWGPAAAVGYALYGLAGAVWIMIFVCPFCRFWGSNSCPCGYGQIAARIRARESGDRFNEKFKKHIPVIVPLWFLPLLAVVPALLRDFTWGLVGLAVAFALDAFVILPRFSTQHGCRECPQRESCPWMGSHR